MADSADEIGMRGKPSRRLTPRAAYKLLGEANLESVDTYLRASALAESGRRRSRRRRLIGVAMNISVQLVLAKGEGGGHHEFLDDVLFGIRARADSGKVDLLLLNEVPCQVSGERTHFGELCQRHGAEGLILVSFLPDEPELTELVASEFPTVAIDTQLIGARASFISSDNVTGAIAAVTHLHGLGRSRIAYLGGWGSEPVDIGRRFGYESALDELGLEARREYIAQAGWSHIRAYEQMRRMLELPEPPDAVFCASDKMAVGAITAAQDAGLKVPDQLAVVGFDDSDLASMVMPSLSSVRQDRFGLGTAAVEAVLRIIDSPAEPPPSILLPVELVVRESSAGEPAQAKKKRAAAAESQASARDTTAGPTDSRFPAKDLYRLLGSVCDPEPRKLGEMIKLERGWEWDLNKRRLVALALDTAPDQSFRHAFFDELFYVLRAEAYREYIDLVLITGVGTRPGEGYPPFLELCRKYRADGIIVASLPMEEQPVRELAEAGFPCVAFDVDLLGKHVAFVMSDNVGGAAMLTRHLIELGHQRIAFIGGRGGERPNLDRRFGYQSELMIHGLPCRDEYVAMANWLPDRAFEATKRFLALPEPPDAIVCCSDVMAIGAMAAIEEAGLRVPDDVAVVGFDDIDYARLVSPSLTTVRQSQDEIAEKMIAAMLSLLQRASEAPVVLVVPIELVVRESSAPGKVEPDC